MAFPGVIRRIILTGFMGAGKSTVGALLAERLGWDFVDVDTVIESRAGKTVAEIFADQGEAVFRALESEAIGELAGREYQVIAPGGGAVEAESTRELMVGLDQTCLVFLDAPLEVLIARCLAQPQAAERPVLARREELARRFEARVPHYSMAHVTVATAGLSPQETVDRVLEAVGRRGAVERREEGMRSDER
ncbi:MAG: shikimate kinase [Acidobacteriaceae bacterium]